MIFYEETQKQRVSALHEVACSVYSITELMCVDTESKALSARFHGLVSNTRFALFMRVAVCRDGLTVIELERGCGQSAIFVCGSNSPALKSVIASLLTWLLFTSAGRLRNLAP